MGSTIEDRHSIISLRDSNGDGAARLCKMFSEKRWNVNGLQTLMKKIVTLALSTDYQIFGVREEPTHTSDAV